MPGLARHIIMTGMAKGVAKIALEPIRTIATSENFVQERHGVIWFTGLLVGTV